MRSFHWCNKSWEISRGLYIIYPQQCPLYSTYVSHVQLYVLPYFYTNNNFFTLLLTFTVWQLCQLMSDSGEYPQFFNLKYLSEYELFFDESSVNGKPLIRGIQKCIKKLILGGLVWRNNFLKKISATCTPASIQNFIMMWSLHFVTTTFRVTQKDSFLRTIPT